MNEVTITASGPVGCAKSALLGEIEIMCKALGIPVRYADEKAAQAEKNGTHADWTEALEMYQPSVVLVERIESNTAPDTSARDAALEDAAEACVIVSGEMRGGYRDACEACAAAIRALSAAAPSADAKGDAS